MYFLCSSHLANHALMTSFTLLLQDEEFLYDLYGVVQHSGNLHGGHYIAYVKYVMNGCELGTVKNTKDKVEKADGGESGYSNMTKVVDSGESGDHKKDEWWYTSDSYVTFAEKTEVEKCQAYLLLYVQRK